MKPQKELKRPSGRTMVVGVFSVLFIFGVAMSFTTPSVTSRLGEKVEKERMMVTTRQNDVALHKEQLKIAKAEDDEMATIVARKELCKAKADLKRDKAYLRADKKALGKLQEIEMQPTATALKESKRDLCTAKKQLKKDLRQGNTSALVDDAELVVKKQKTVNRHEAKLNKQEEALDSELAAIDNKPDQNGKTVLTTKERWFGWNATASADKTYFEPAETSTAVLEK